MANIQIVINAINKASNDLMKVKNDVKGVGDAGTQAKGGVEGFTQGLSSLLGKAALVAGVAVGVSRAIKGVYEAAKEGAELEYARARFDNLAASIGTVSDALLGDLRDATSGMMSDAELVASAGDLMALGLAKSHDEVVRLTSVAGALGMNMNQLVLALTNQTTARFDQLGVSVDGFDAKVKKLKETGLSASDAFKEAFLQQAEEQIEKVGNRADSAAGSFDKLKAATTNLSDSLKRELAPIIAPIAEGLAELINNLAPVDDSRMPEFINKLTTAMKDGAIFGDQYDEMLRNVHNGFISIPDGISQVNQALDEHRQKVALANDANQAQIVSLFNATTSWSEFKQEAEAAGLDLGWITEEIYNAQKAEDALAEDTAKAAIEAKMAAGDYEGLASALGITTDEAKLLTKEWQEHEKMLAQLEGLKLIENNYKGIIDLAYKYTDILAEITEQETIMANNPIGSEKYEEAKGKVEALKGSMADLANRVTLDMFQATIAIGGVTEAELSAYMQMAIDMGLMSEEGAQAAIDAYGKAIETINGYEIDDKTANVVVDDAEAFGTLTKIEQYSPRVKYEVDDSAVRVYRPPTLFGTIQYNTTLATTRAVGGAVTGGNPYTWQEYGYRGEVFVPSADGFVLSRADAERALARALYGGESAIDPEAIGKAVAKALSGITGNKQGGNVYNLTMPTSSNPADVRMAFELLEAWA